MIGVLLNERECKELNYILRKELDEMLLDLNDQRIDLEIRNAIETRYKIVFRMFGRLASSKELSKYARSRNYR